MGRELIALDIFLLATYCTYIPLVTAQVYFYDRNGNLLDSTFPTTDCQRLPSNAFNSTNKITADRCVMVYTDTSCFYGYSLKINPNSPEPYTANGESLFPDFHIKAIRLCSESERRSRLQVELFREATPYDRQEFFGPIYSQAPQRIAMYSLKHCTNIAASLKQTIGSISNSGTCVRLFTEENCEGRSFDLRGGSTRCSNNLASCGIEAEVDKIRVATKLDLHNVGLVKLADKTLLLNNGSKKTVAEYNQSKSIFNTITVLRQDMLDKINIMSTNGIAIDYLKPILANESPGVPVYTIFNTFAYIISNALIKAHNFTHRGQLPSSVNYTKVSTYDVSKTYELPPCSANEVSPFIEVLENTQAKYSARLKITGTSNGARMKSEDIKQHLGRNFSYIGTKDMYTVLVNTTGIIQAKTIGLGTVIKTNVYGQEGNCNDNISNGQKKSTVHFVWIGLGVTLLAIMMVITCVILSKFIRRKRKWVGVTIRESSRELEML